jgi:hypothetical protein
MAFLFKPYNGGAPAGRGGGGQGVGEGDRATRHRQRSPARPLPCCTDAGAGGLGHTALLTFESQPPTRGRHRSQPPAAPPGHQRPTNDQPPPVPDHRPEVVKEDGLWQCQAQPRRRPRLRQGPSVRPRRPAVGRPPCGPARGAGRSGCRDGGKGEGPLLPDEGEGAGAPWRLLLLPRGRGRAGRGWGRPRGGQP